MNSSAPNSARDNAWRQAKAIAEEEPMEAVKIARELMGSSDSSSVHEEVLRSLVAILCDPVTYPKTPIVKEISNCIMRKPIAKTYLGSDGVSALAAMMCDMEEAAKVLSAQILINIGRDAAVHEYCVDACLEQLRDDDNSVKTKISLCRVLNVIMLYDGGATIVARKGIIDIAKVLSVDKTWDSFAVKTLTALADGTSKRDAEIVNALLDVAAGVGSSKDGKLRGNLAHLLSILSAKNKTSVLQSREGVHTAVPIVVDLLKEEEASARAYATETLLNICKGDARVTESSGNMQDLERVSSYVIFALIKLMQEGETDVRVTALTLEKVCRIISAIIVDNHGQWRVSKVWSERELVTEIGIVIAAAEGEGYNMAAVRACRGILISGMRQPDGITRQVRQEPDGTFSFSQGLGPDGHLSFSQGPTANDLIAERMKMMYTVLADQLRWAYWGNYDRSHDQVKGALRSVMDSLGVSIMLGSPGLDFHLKVVCKNVKIGSVHASEASYQYDGERGRRVYRSVKEIRTALSDSKSFEAAASAVCKSGVLEHMVALLDEKADKYHLLEAETLWALTNVCAGNEEQTLSVVEAGAVPAMVRLLNSEDPTVQDNSLWALANIAADSSYGRDAIITCGVVEAVQLAHSRGVLHNQKSMTDLTFMTKNIMLTKPLPHAETTKGLIPIMCDFLKHIHPNEDIKVHDPSKMLILSQVLATLSGFTSQDEQGEMSMDIVMDGGLVPIIVTILNNNLHAEDSGRVTGDAQLIGPGARILGNFCGGSEVHTQAVVDAGGVDTFFTMTRYIDQSIQKEAWWTLSNIGAGSSAQVESLIRLGVFSRAFDILSATDWSFDKSGTKYKDPFFFGAPLKVKGEILWLINNVLPEDDSEEELLERQALMTKVLSSKHSQAGEEHDEEDEYHGVTALFEAVSVCENDIINRRGDVDKNVEMATSIMSRLKILTSDRCLEMNQGIRAKIKEKGKRLVGILKSVLRQPGNLARHAEDITEAIIMHL